MSGHKGVSLGQDGRFMNKEKKLMKTMKFPPEFKEKVDMTKVELPVLRPWIAQRFTECLDGVEDEIMISWVYSMLENDRKPNPKSLQIQITGVLEHNAPKFTLDLWKMLLSAQSNGGIPQELLDEEKRLLEERQKDRSETMEHIRSIKEKLERKAEDKQYGLAVSRKNRRDDADNQEYVPIAMDRRINQGPGGRGRGDSGPRRGRDYRRGYRERHDDRDRESRDDRDRRSRDDRDRDRDRRDRDRDRDRRDRDRDRDRSDRDRERDRSDRRDRDRDRDRRDRRRDRSSSRERERARERERRRRARYSDSDSDSDSDSRRSTRKRSRSDVSQSPSKRFKVDDDALIKEDNLRDMALGSLKRDGDKE